ncbi:Late embryogenesis abundant protein [Musa troglodytarum]|uniref:Late embryogenesis abundant protein n=1 Tax=Musa troglodytarum TaxID=320322 RepID=A0A9E7K6T8_9LILI|nr:Late embryogenesis abundant protein [Musa troglodytarum]
MMPKRESDATSLTSWSATQSPLHRPVYYVTSPVHSHHDAIRISFSQSSPGASPIHPYYHPYHHQRYGSSPIHHSRESNARISSSWRKLPTHHHGPSESDDDDGRVSMGCYVTWFVLAFVLLFTLFSFILWGASLSYKPQVIVKDVVFRNYDLHAGTDITGVPTNMISINSTVRIAFRNPATFFGVQTSSTPLEMYYSEFKVASGHMEEFYLSRESRRVVVVAVAGVQVPLYGGGSSLRSHADDGGAPAVVPLELTFTVLARAHVLGQLVKVKFYRRVRCSVTLREGRLGKPLTLAKACEYRDR